VRKKRKEKRRRKKDERIKKQKKYKSRKKATGNKTENTGSRIGCGSGTDSHTEYLTLRLQNEQRYINAHSSTSRSKKHTQLAPCSFAQTIKDLEDQHKAAQQTKRINTALSHRVFFSIIQNKSTLRRQKLPQISLSVNRTANFRERSPYNTDRGKMFSQSRNFQKQHQTP
jgi:hypothetical protein